MVFDIETYKSHPNKTLLQHTKGVSSKVKRLTNSDMAELAAIFHDFGKLNPNFQDKLLGGKCQGYSNHAFLSAFSFFCMACKKKYKDLNFVYAVCVLIAKHHGNLPNFIEKDNEGGLSKLEMDHLGKFLCNNHLSIPEFAKLFLECDSFADVFYNERAFLTFRNKVSFDLKSNINPLVFFLDTQFSFAALIQSDKVDAACFDEYSDSNENNIEAFCKIFNPVLDNYLSKLNQDSELNKIRTEIRQTAVLNLSKKLSSSSKVFELTSPTGSGKTLMLLSLAGEIIKQKGPKRIIYAIPFLSITEQVENEVLKIFDGYTDYIQRIDSKSNNERFDNIQEELESSPSEDLYKEINLIDFREKSFDYPFVITTFVRFFETLLSNKNSELLKLPNFANSIFLLDEIQSLPPRLYTFFVGFLSKFCEKFNSYAIISTATQPNFSLQEGSSMESFFKDYQKPESILPLSYFDNDLFNRYSISFDKEGVSIDQLCDRIIEKDNSVLVILNTIDDTKNLYVMLSERCFDTEIILLNTHFTPNDRKRKISRAKKLLKGGQMVILVSTQLIEAGVDIDFPVLFRDFTTVSSIVQSAGRCNRNGKLSQKGDVNLFFLQNEQGRNRVDLIFRGRDKELVRFTKQSFSESYYQEKELMSVQNSFFNSIQSELTIGDYGPEKDRHNLISEIKKCAFETIGKFSLIDKQEFGEVKRFYVAEHEDDFKFEILLDLQDELIDLLKHDAEDNIISVKKKQIHSHLKLMANQIVEVRMKKDQSVPIMSNSRDYFGLIKIDPEFYSYDTGVNLNQVSFII